MCISGNRNVDQVMHMLLGNPNLVGTLLAFFLDNTVPGKYIFDCGFFVYAIYKIIVELLRQFSDITYIDVWLYTQFNRFRFF